MKKMKKKKMKMGTLREREREMQRGKPSTQQYPCSSSIHRTNRAMRA
jgi:hypothetical protein